VTKSAVLTTKELQNYGFSRQQCRRFIRSCRDSALHERNVEQGQLLGETYSALNANGGRGNVTSPLNNALFVQRVAEQLTRHHGGLARHVSDPGCNCDTPVNPNSDMVPNQGLDLEPSALKIRRVRRNLVPWPNQAVRISMDRLSLYARNYALNANDAQFNANGQGRPENKYYYPALRSAVRLFPAHTRSTGQPE